MKKLIAILLAVAMMAAMGTVASAEEHTMQLKTTVPAATYTLYIPASLEVPYGAVECDIPLPEVVESEGFAGKKLCLFVNDYKFFGYEDGTDFQMRLLANLTPVKESVSLIRSDEGMLRPEIFFLCEANGDSLAPELYINGINGETPDMVESLSLQIDKGEWVKLSPGEHTGHITFGIIVCPV